MGWFGFGDEGVSKTVDAIGGAVTGTIESINYALSGDLPPDVRVKLEDIKLKMQEIDLKVSEGQVEINKIEAQSPSLFKSGWRPAIGWIGVIALFYHFIAYDVALWYLKLTGSAVMPPELNERGLMELIFGILGLGVYRTYEKYKGVSK